MVCLTTLPEIEVSILVDSKVLEEYGGSPIKAGFNESIKYIEATPGTKFSVDFSRNGLVKKRIKTPIAVTIVLNGSTIYTGFYPRTKMVGVDEIADSENDIEDARRLVFPREFNAVAQFETDHDDPELNVIDHISINIWSIKIIRHNQKRLIVNSPDHNIDEEPFNYLHEYPFATYTFLYRSRNFLFDRAIISRSASNSSISPCVNTIAAESTELVVKSSQDEPSKSACIREKVTAAFNQGSFYENEIINNTFPDMHRNLVLTDIRQTKVLSQYPELHISCEVNAGSSNSPDVGQIGHCANRDEAVVREDPGNIEMGYDSNVNSNACTQIVEIIKEKGKNSVQSPAVVECKGSFPEPPLSPPVSNYEQNNCEEADYRKYGRKHNFHNHSSSSSSSSTSSITLSSFLDPQISNLGPTGPIQASSLTTPNQLSNENKSFLPILPSKFCEFLYSSPAAQHQASPVVHHQALQYREPHTPTKCASEEAPIVDTSSIQTIHEHQNVQPYLDGEWRHAHDPRDRGQTPIWDFEGAEKAVYWELANRW